MNAMNALACRRGTSGPAIATRLPNDSIRSWRISPAKAPPRTSTYQRVATIGSLEAIARAVLRLAGAGTVRVVGAVESTSTARTADVAVGVPGAVDLAVSTAARDHAVGRSIAGVLAPAAGAITVAVRAHLAVEGAIAVGARLIAHSLDTCLLQRAATAGDEQ